MSMDHTAHDIAQAPLPTPRTLRRRSNPLFQLWRFFALNRRFIIMILKGDH
jgi:hypothetical protein